MCPAPPDIYPLTHPLSRPAPLPIAAAATGAASTLFHRTRRSEDIIDLAVAQPGEDVNRFSEVLRIAQVLDHPIGRATACVQIDARTRVVRLRSDPDPARVRDGLVADRLHQDGSGVGAPGDKIGRASCRERVCQYV